MPGYHADPDQIAAAAKALRDAANAVGGARLDAYAHTDLGSARLDAAVAGLTATTRRDLDAVRDTLLADADLADQIGRGYAELDHNAAADLTREADR
jgi:hypothetical protein